jgi:hypothetical protein
MEWKGREGRNREGRDREREKDSCLSIHPYSRSAIV